MSNVKLIYLGHVSIGIFDNGVVEIRSDAPKGMSKHYVFRNGRQIQFSFESIIDENGIENNLIIINNDVEFTRVCKFSLGKDFKKNEDEINEIGQNLRRLLSGHLY
jgi:hypothetical protein